MKTRPLAEWCECKPWREIHAHLINHDKMNYCFSCGKHLQKLPESIWIRCEWPEAEEHRHRTLTGSIGLEGAWSEWKPGKPEKCWMNREYQYRRKRENPDIIMTREESDGN
jgi:hypothetical protein